MGALMGILGGGGSVLTVPILVYLFGVDAYAATTLSLVVVGSSAALGSVQYMRQKLVSFRTVVWFGLPSIAGVFVSQFLIRPAIPDNLFWVGDYQFTKGMGIMVLFAILMLGSSYGMIKKQKKREPAAPSQAKPNIPLVMSQGLIAGLVIGLVGAGGGFLIVPALVFFFRLPMKIAVGTSLTIIAINSLAGFAGGVQTLDEIPWKILLPITAISLSGILVGSALSKKIPSDKLKPIFGWFVLAMAIFIVTKTLVG